MTTKPKPLIAFWSGILLAWIAYSAALVAVSSTISG